MTLSIVGASALCLESNVTPKDPICPMQCEMFSVLIHGSCSLIEKEQDAGCTVGLQ